MLLKWVKVRRPSFISISPWYFVLVSFCKEVKPLLIQGLSKTNNMSLYKERVRWIERDICVRISVNIGRWVVGCRCCAIHMKIPYITLSTMAFWSKQSLNKLTSKCRLQVINVNGLFMSRISPSMHNSKN